MCMRQDGTNEESLDYMVTESIDVFEEDDIDEHLYEKVRGKNLAKSSHVASDARELNSPHSHACLIRRKQLPSARQANIRRRISRLLRVSVVDIT